LLVHIADTLNLLCSALGLCQHRKQKRRQNPDDGYHNEQLHKCQTTILMIMATTHMRLTKKAEPPQARDVNRDSGTANANGGWLRRLSGHFTALEVWV
jgi:hypothetical protein